MPRKLRIDRAGCVYHVVNRSVGRVQIFSTPDDYLLFIKLLIKAISLFDIDLLAYSVMPNHWHLLVRPNKDSEMGKFMHWLTTTHTCKIRSITSTIGNGPVYQGRYKSFMVDSSNYLIRAIRYIERNPVRAGLVQFTYEWRWGSSWVRKNDSKLAGVFISEIPKEFYVTYSQILEESEDEKELAIFRNSVNKETPLGDKDWVLKMVSDYGLESTIRSKGGQERKLQHKT